MKKLMMMAVAMLAVGGAMGDTWTDPDTGVAWTYGVSNNKASLGGRSSSSTAVPISTSGALRIPSSLGGYPVASIGEYAFHNCTNLTSVTIPNGVTSIGYVAFDGCANLTGVTIPNSVTSIGQYAFRRCSRLTRVTIPDSVTSIGDSAFYCCSGLTSVTIGNSVTSIGGWAFDYCSGLTEVAIPDSVTNIGEHAFAVCTGLKHITIGDGLRSIPEVAFGGSTNLTSVTIGSSLETIPWALTEVLSAINVSPASPYYSSADGILYDKARTRLIRCPLALTAVSVPFGVRVIGAYSFMACQKLSNIALPSTVVNIEEDAFYNCRFASIALPDSLSNIGDCAFSSCTNLVQIVLPNSVTNIGYGAFSWCKSLQSVIFQNSAPMVGEDAFANVSETCCAYVPAKASGYDVDSNGKWQGLVLKRVENPAQAGGGSEVEVRYALSDSPSDRSVAAITVNTDMTLDDFAPVDGKVYDSLLYVNNTADHEVALSLPSGHVYKTVKGAKPLTIPASSQCIISITRIADNVFLVMREELEDVE